jgi:hypothetical protein
LDISDNVFAWKLSSETGASSMKKFDEGFCPISSLRSDDSAKQKLL